MKNQELEEEQAVEIQDQKMSKKSTFLKLQENDENVYNEVFDILLKVLDNIIKAPTNLKYRKLRLANEIVSNKLMPAIGALESLFEFGFEEADEYLMLPQSISLNAIKRIREEFKQCHDEYLLKSHGRFTSTALNHCRFFDEIQGLSKRVLLYEDENLQTVARKLIPIDELTLRCSKQIDEKDDFAKEFGLLFELMHWFKHEFFKWMDAPTCENCNSPSTFQGCSQRLVDLDTEIRVEEYSCTKCSNRITFPRYNDPAKLLETRRGRCGEWTNCFCLLCRSLGYETRFVLDKTDHVWAEVYSKTLSRWIHCDPCENAIDSPLMYEKGWNKKLTYVLAVSCEEIQDVTWRYTTEFEQTRGRRKLCPEEDLVLFILKLSNELQTSLPQERKKYLAQRRLFECIEMLTPSEVVGEYSGRTSGSLQWRLSRKECQPFPKNHIWEPNKVEVNRRKFQLRYFCAKNIYQRIENDVLKGWENGAYEFESIFRKEEPDWKMSYLCRTKGSDCGTIKWKFSSKNQRLPIEYVSIFYQCSTFHSAENFTKTDVFYGSYDLTLTATLTGGSGKDSWQHAQLFRQSLEADELEFSMEVIIKFKEE